jgi:hypothetical protein
MRKYVFDCVSVKPHSATSTGREFRYVKGKSISCVTTRSQLLSLIDSVLHLRF